MNDVDLDGAPPRTAVRRMLPRSEAMKMTRKVFAPGSRVPSWARPRTQRARGRGDEIGPRGRFSRLTANEMFDALFAICYLLQPSIAARTEAPRARRGQAEAMPADITQQHEVLP